MDRMLVVALCAFLLSAAAVSQQADVGTAPKLVTKPELSYPNQALMGRVSGKVWLKILVGKDGVPIKTRITGRDPETAYLFDTQARKWGMQCRFTPATDASGNPMSIWITIPLSFKLDDCLPPQCIRQAKPEYPKEALELGLEGWVGLAVLIKSNGDVDPSETFVVWRDPANETVFDQAAKDAANHSQYLPAGYQASAISGWCFIKVPFYITGDASSLEE